MAFVVRSTLIIVLFCSSLFNFYNEVEGIRRLSEEEDLELDDQLKRLNKPAVKTIETKYGVLYDCIDFFKQPAFDHPALKNHNFHLQMRPTTVPKVMNNESESNTTSHIKMLHVDLRFEGCPFGTVPIRRVTKDDLIRAKLHLERYAGNETSSLSADYPGLYGAMVKTTFSSTKYNGGGTDLGTYNPQVQISQYSSAQMIIQNGVDSIRFGWMVNPSLYGDNGTHLFTFLKTKTLQCYNLRCPGFVIVRSDFTVDKLIENVSKKGELPHYLKFMIVRDPQTGYWWLKVGEENIKVGFWPGGIFTELGDMGTSIEWGGEVFSPSNIPSPPMGSGTVLDDRVYDTIYDSFCSRMTIVTDDVGVITDVKSIFPEYEIGTYRVVDAGFRADEYRHIMFYGGPGGTLGPSH